MKQMENRKSSTRSRRGGTTRGAAGGRGSHEWMAGAARAAEGAGGGNGKIVWRSYKKASRGVGGNGRRTGEAAEEAGRVNGKG
jgi:hypothetical protein